MNLSRIANLAGIHLAIAKRLKKERKRSLARGHLMAARSLMMVLRVEHWDRSSRNFIPGPYRMIISDVRQKPVDWRTITELYIKLHPKNSGTTTCPICLKKHLRFSKDEGSEGWWAESPCIRIER